MAKTGSTQKTAVKASQPKGAASKNVDRGVWGWIESEKGRIWETPLIPEGDTCVATVKRSFSKELDSTFKFYAYRSGRVLGRRDTVDAAKKLAESGKADPRDDAVALYAKNHSGDIPMFLRLSEKERQQVRQHYRYDAPAASKVEAFERAAVKRGLTAADMTDPGTVKLLEEMAAKDRGAAAAAGVERPKGRSAGSSATTKAERAAVDVQDAAKLSSLRDGNPKKEGSAAWKRWDLLLDHARKGSNVGAFLKDGGNPETLRNAVLKGWVKMEGGK